MGTLLDEALGPQTTNQGLQRGKVFLIKDGVGCCTRAFTSSFVLFLALSDLLSHYDRILGCNLTAHRGNKKFIFFDFLLLECPGVEWGSLVEGGLFELYGKIHKVVELNAASNGNGNICIMIDDVSLLEIAARGFLDSVLKFLHYCGIYLNMPHPRFLLQIEYFADVIISLTVLNNGSFDEQGLSKNKICNFQFRIKENSVKYFYPGTKI
ncbi:hypothetical protein AMTRI_Chr08g207040 [Amborella trichopoda]